MYKKIISFILATVLTLSLGATALAEDNIDIIDQNVNQISNVTTFIGDDGITYEYIRYNDPVSYEYDGKTQTLLGCIRRQQSADKIEPYDYREWTEWKIIDNGIVSSWVNMSNPYFVRSIARGETYEESVEKQVSISAKAGIVPSGSQSSVNNALKADFSLSLSGTYSKRITITLSGPNNNYNTRTFYYKTGYHKHTLTIIEELHSNWDGLIRSTTYTNQYGYEPAVQSYSVDSNV